MVMMVMMVMMIIMMMTMMIMSTKTMTLLPIQRKASKCVKYLL